MCNSVGFLCFSCFNSEKGNISLSELFLKCSMFFYNLDVFYSVLELLLAVGCESDIFIGIRSDTTW